MIREQVLEYFKGDELATDVFLSKYSLILVIKYNS